MEWINIKDKVPEDDTWILGINAETQYGEYGIWLDSENKFHLPHCDYLRMEITHWMLFPEAPKNE